MAEDKRTIGVSEAADRVLADVVEQAHFSDGVDAATFAMAIAINAGACEGELNLIVEGANTKWNVGSFEAGSSAPIPPDRPPARTSTSRTGYLSS